MLLLLNFVANFFLCTIYLFLLISAKEKNGQKQVKKKAFKINAVIEDVGLMKIKKVRKQEMVTKFS